MDVVKMLLWPIPEPPWHALVALCILSGHYALVRLALWRKKAVFVDIWNTATIALWIAFWLYQIHMWGWEKTVHAPIRLDLFPAAIILYTATIICLLSSWESLLSKFDGEKGVRNHFFNRK
jgi:hypothetical protein